MVVITIHVILGIILFFIINWIGKHSYSIGYIEVSIFVKMEEAPAFNFLLRVLTPVIYIIIVSAILYNWNLDRWVVNIYLVNVYYILFRLVINLTTNRGLLLNWYRQLLYWSAIIVISYFTYTKIIRVKTNILPDFTTLANELWIIILIFLFQLVNNIRLSQEGAQNRKENYLRKQYKFFQNKYGGIIKDLTNNEILETVVYAIIIYEDFNRPKLFRIIENIKFLITQKPHSLGVMQVKTNKFINDKQSIEQGTKIILKAHSNYLKKVQEGNNRDYYGEGIYEIINEYNLGDSYMIEVGEIALKIREYFYPNTTDQLVK